MSIIFLLVIILLRICNSQWLYEMFFSFLLKMGESGTTTIFLLSPVDVVLKGVASGSMAYVYVSMAYMSKFVA